MNVRRRFRIVLDDGQKHEVETNAFDLVEGEREGEGPIAQGFRTVHAALLRLKVQGVPASFPAFLQRVDDFDDITDEAAGVGAGDMDPTSAAV